MKKQLVSIIKATALSDPNVCVSRGKYDFNLHIYAGSVILKHCISLPFKICFLPELDGLLCSLHSTSWLSLEEVY